MIKITARKIRETDRGICINDGTGDRWLPLSQIKYQASKTHIDYVDLEIPEWLAKAKGLI